MAAADHQRPDLEESVEDEEFGDLLLEGCSYECERQDYDEDDDVLLSEEDPLETVAEAIGCGGARSIGLLVSAEEVSNYAGDQEQPEDGGCLGPQNEYKRRDKTDGQADS